METGRSGHCSLHRRQATDPRLLSRSPLPHASPSLSRLRAYDFSPTVPHNAPVSLRGCRNHNGRDTTIPGLPPPLPPSFTSVTSKLFGFNLITGRKLTATRESTRLADWNRRRGHHGNRSHNAQQQQQQQQDQSRRHEHETPPCRGAYPPETWRSA